MQTVIGTNINIAKELLNRSELVAIPTETVYGLAANACNPDAVIKIFEAKNRPHFNPLIVHTQSWSAAMQYVQHVPEIAHVLASEFAPGPLTFLLPKQNNIPDLVTAGSSLVAIRVPNHPMTLDLLKQLDFPLAAPSANQFGYISPTTAHHVLDSLNGKINYILDGGQTLVGLESTIIGFDNAENVLVHRVGGIAIEDIEKVIGKKVLMANENTQIKPQTAGQLKSHYAPDTPLYIGDIEELYLNNQDKKIALISLSNPYNHLDITHRFPLSLSGNLKEAAQKLFAVLRQIDELEVEIIFAEKFPNEGLGIAINDRLSRAQAIFK
ncbi:MAG: L-threonylcarbamoyladenylate synthase [Bacteroidota bacterium]